MSSADQVQQKLRVLVVGGGVVGASIAWHLSRHQAVIVTVVAKEIGGTATPKSFAWLNASWHNPKFYYDFRRRSMARWKELAEEVPGLRSLIHWNGSLQWDLSPEQLAKYEREHSAWGYDIHRVERKEIMEREPCLVENALPEWGVRVAEEGAVEAADAALMMISDAQTHGARVVEEDVANLLRDGDCVAGVKTASGEQFFADHVILAAGVGTVQLCTSVGIDLPATGKPGLLMHTKPVAKRLLNGLVFSDKVHMRQAADGCLLAYTGFNDSDPGEDARTSTEEIFETVKGMFKVEAGSEDVLELDHFTIGDRPMPQDGLPILGSSGLKGLSLAIMHSGVTLAAIVGKVLTEEIVNGVKDPAMDAFALGRFRAIKQEE